MKKRLIDYNRLKQIRKKMRIQETEQYIFWSLHLWTKNIYDWLQNKAKALKFITDVINRHIHKKSIICFDKS